MGAMGDGPGTWLRRRASQPLQKKSESLAEASAYVRKPAHLQWALAKQPSHSTESGCRLDL